MITPVYLGLSILETTKILIYELIRLCKAKASEQCKILLHE